MRAQVLDLQASISGHVWLYEGKRRKTAPRYGAAITPRSKQRACDAYAFTTCGIPSAVWRSTSRASCKYRRGWGRPTSRPPCDTCTTRAAQTMLVCSPPRLPQASRKWTLHRIVTVRRHIPQRFLDRRHAQATGCLTNRAAERPRGGVPRLTARDQGAPFCDRRGVPTLSIKMLIGRRVTITMLSFWLANITKHSHFVSVRPPHPMRAARSPVFASVRILTSCSNCAWDILSDFTETTATYESRIETIIRTAMTATIAAAARATRLRVNRLLMTQISL